MVDIIPLAAANSHIGTNGKLSPKSATDGSAGWRGVAAVVALVELLC